MKTHRFCPDPTSQNSSGARFSFPILPEGIWTVLAPAFGFTNSFSIAPREVVKLASELKGKMFRLQWNAKPSRAYYPVASDDNVVWKGFGSVLTSSVPIMTLEVSLSAKHQFFRIAHFAIETTIRTKFKLAALRAGKVASQNHFQSM